MSIRMPTYQELVPEQLAILEEAPLEENLMVIGPPGTGKTIIAMWRAKQTCTDTDETASLIMYNNVLTSYSDQWKDQHDGVRVCTYHKWAWGHWSANFSGKPPLKPADRWQYDWNEITRRSLESKVGLGHLIVDEAQDHPPDFYAALGILTSQDYIDSTACVVADENQRLDESKNSSLNQIQSGIFALMPTNLYTLDQNHRNTKEIATLASKFYVGLQTGIPKLPERKGRVPKVVEYDDLSSMTNAICNYARNNPNHSILVVAGKNLKKCFNKIEHRLKGNSSYRVEGYKSNKDKAKAFLHGKPVLHTGDSSCITCVHWKSMKGLESDAVFVPQFESHDMGGDTQDEEMMRLYVLSSRAREYLEFQITSTERSSRMVQTLKDTAEDSISWE